MSYSVNLRTLTWKSSLGFGKHADLTIYQIMSLRTGANYIRYIYYKYEKINFIDDILIKANIKEVLGNKEANFDIQKPGKDLEKLEELKEFFREYFSDKNTALQTIIFERFLNKMKRGERTGKKVCDVLKNSKKNLQAKNHGK